MIDLNLSSIRFDYKPYPIGVAPNIFRQSFYQSLLSNWPPTSLFDHKPELGNKYSLSSLNNSNGYFNFLRQNNIWKATYNTLNSADYFFHIITTLKQHHIDLCLPRHKFIAKHVSSQSKSTRPSILRKYISRIGNVSLVSSRFEFSMMPANGGYILPHTDSPNKIITVVFSMNNDDEWNNSWGGGTTAMDTINPQKSFNFRNDQLKFDECQSLKTYDFNPNQCLIFIKTFNSLHAVLPMDGPSEAMRKTLTLNIEYLDS
jgi:hypothetical protein